MTCAVARLQDFECWGVNKGDADVELVSLQTRLAFWSISNSSAIDKLHKNMLTCQLKSKNTKK